MGSERLIAACLPFAAGPDPRANAATVRAGIAAAASAGAGLLLTPECCLPGYPSAARPDLSAADWCQITELEDQLALAADAAGLCLVLGSASPLGGDPADGVGNDAVVCGSVPRVRYRKRRLTPTDRAHFVAGQQACAVTVAGWRLGIAICYDLRFHDVFRELAADGADAFAVIAHMAGPDPDPGTKAAVIPTLCAARAAEFATPLAFCNTAAADRYCDSGLWDARGMRTSGAGSGLLVQELRRRESFDPWYANLRREVLGGAG